MLSDRALLVGAIFLGLILVSLPSSARAEGGTSHMVESGDTLASIAKEYGVSLVALVRANSITDPDLIRIGQRLLVPDAASAAIEASDASALPLEQPASAIADQAVVSSYTVKPGQTLSQIADELEVSASAIIQLNGLTDANVIRAGTELQLPAGAKDAGAPFAGQGTRFVASISDQRCWLYVEGQLAGNWRCSTGRQASPTVPGTYTIQSKINPAYAPAWDFYMPYWLGLYYSGGVEDGIHGLPYNPETGRKTWEGLVGTPITYGCIMLDDVNAKQLFEVAYVGMPVTILP